MLAILLLQAALAEAADARAVVEIERESRQEISAIVDQTYARRSAAQERIGLARTQAIRGETLIRDPTTGPQFTVPSGPNYYYRIGAGAQFIGSESADAPNSPNYWVQEMKVIR